MGTMKTPGVYIVEKDAFPNSVVEVATAVPAFVGYTKFAKKGQKEIYNQPIRISSMAEYETFFGGAYKDKFILSKPGSAAATQASTSGSGGSGRSRSQANAAQPEENATAAETPAAEPSGNVITINDTKFVLARSAHSPRFLMYRSMQIFFKNGGGVCYVVSVGNYDATLAGKALTDGIATLIKEQEPTMLVVPEAISLDSLSACAGVQNEMVMHCGTVMKNRIAILDVFEGNKTDQDNDCIKNFRSSVTADNLDFASAYYPWIKTSLVDISELDFDNFSTHTSEDAKSGRAKLLSLITDEFKADSTDSTIPEDQKPAALALFTAREAMIKKVKAGMSDKDKTEIAKSLFVSSDVYKMILKEVQLEVNEMATSAAMAGVYTRVDNNQGVWKAPANLSIVGMDAPTVELSLLDQETLNVDLDGKSINAIRTFTRGPTIWGARTLDGNSLDWRYISVRRTVVMLEQSIKYAANAYVFEANDGQTWVTMRSMINNFLTGIWKRGGLAGASPQDAFHVSVGLGETMTANDILEGILRISVLIAVTRPAEFIEITFQQQQQKS